MKKITSVVLAVCMLLSAFAVCGYATFAASVSSDSTGASSDNSQYAQDTVQGGAVLHCFDWSYNTIKANLKDIYNAGYTAVQTSPVQTPKDYSASWTDTSGQWWKLYQPIDFNIASSSGSWLGGATELKALCTEADKYGIKVIVDIVANHMANDGTDYGIYSGVDSAIKSNSSYWHNTTYRANDSSRNNVTHGSIGMPDLNTGNSTIQNYVLTLLKNCVDCGVDGFRFDAAKHIELPTDSEGSSNFWPTVINGINSYKSGLYIYGEILGSPLTDISNYTKYMAVTDDATSANVRNGAVNQSGDTMKSSTYEKGASASNSVLWVESHDNYESDGTGSISSTVINRAWSIIGSRNASTSLYFARPASTMGSASTDVSWKSTAVAEVNKFKNFFNGTSEYLESYYKVAYNIRNGQGVVLCNTEGAGTVNVPNPSGTMAAGTYYDQVTGNKFTVTSSWITGTVGDTGVAVVYNPDDDIKGNTLSTDYYLIGYFDGKDYDGTNYKFTGGSETATLTTSFSEDSYVYLKNADSSSYYMLPTYSQGPSATFYKTLGYGDNTYAEKMKVPGGVQVTFTLSANSDGSLNLSYTTGSTVTTTAAVTSAGTTSATKTLSKTYYMIGYINGADYGCESDYTNMGTYKFASGSDGKLTTSFTKDSYVFIKQENNANWYMLSDYSKGPSATYKNTTTGTKEKMLVPANTTYEFTLVENSDGTLTLSYAVPQAATTAAPTTVASTTAAPTTVAPTTEAPEKNYYVMGNFNNAADTNDWSKSISLSASGTANVVTGSAELAKGTYEFKIHDGTDGWYGNGGSIEDTTEKTSPGLGWEMNGDTNCKLVASGGTYTFSYNISTNYLIITYSGSDTTDKEYCLFGYINGADYGKNDDSATIGDYIFDKDGKLTVTFETDSYVAVKTTDNKTWYMLAEYSEGPSATYHISVYGDNTYSQDMKVPAGKVEFTLTENADGTLTLAFELVEEPTEEPTTVAPTTVVPTTAAPTTAAPTTAAPTTVAPTTAAPTTVAPTTAAPTTVAPTTAAPTTVEPTTVEPTTVEPTTVAPTTEAPTQPTTVPDGLHVMNPRHSLSLDGKIGICYYYDLSDEILGSKNVYVKFTQDNVDGSTNVALDKNAKNSSGYRFIYYVFAKEMTDTIYSQLYVNGEAYGTVETYSVREYCDTAIEKSSNENLKTLAKALLNYGARSQVVFSYNLDKLANDGIDYTAAELSDAELAGIADIDSGTAKNRSNVGISDYYGLSLALQSDTMMRVHFTVSDENKFASSGTTYKYRYKGQGSEDLVDTTATKTADDRYCIDVPNISSSDLGKTYEIVVRYSRFSVTVTVSPLNYVKNVLNSSSASEAYKNLATGIYRYSEAATAYFTN